MVEDEYVSHPKECNLKKSQFELVYVDRLSFDKLELDDVGSCCVRS